MWTRGEISLVATAVRRAPSVGDAQPWELEFAGATASLLGRGPAGRDRTISCGAALANLLLAVRVLGWHPRLAMFPDPARPCELARVSRGERHPPSDVDIARHAAIPVRRSHRGPLAATRLTQQLVTASAAEGVRIRPVRGLDEVTALADLLALAGLKCQPDPETVLLIETHGDTRLDHLLAGRALQDIWLAATSAGLAGSVLARSPYLARTRPGRTGWLQALVRLGQV
jgi:hypothetical protein